MPSGSPGASESRLAAAEEMCKEVITMYQAAKGRDQDGRPVDLRGCFFFFCVFFFREDARLARGSELQLTERDIAGNDCWLLVVHGEWLHGKVNLKGLRGIVLNCWA